MAVALGLPVGLTTEDGQQPNLVGRIIAGIGHASLAKGSACAEAFLSLLREIDCNCPHLRIKRRVLPRCFRKIPTVDERIREPARQVVGTRNITSAQMAGLLHGSRPGDGRPGGGDGCVI